MFPQRVFIWLTESKSVEKYGKEALKISFAINKSLLPETEIIDLELKDKIKVYV